MSKQGNAGSSWRLKAIAGTFFVSCALVLVLFAIKTEPSRSPHSAEEPVDLLFHVPGTTGLTSFRLTPAQARGFHKIIMGSPQLERNADHRYTSTFFKVADDIYYWRGTLLSLRPEAGSHWTWRGSDRLARLSRAIVDAKTPDQVRASLHVFEDEPSSKTAATMPQ